ncbi:hypothetical protein I4U23_014531 [Adineta vaga]|nr:hypothetical protein I4U23_014531 [Adineta vaga]
MTTIIIITSLIILVIYEQVVLTIQYSIGPSFTSTIITKQKLYYNNLGLRLDCTATGNPLPSITWFRTNGSHSHQLISVQSSELINLYENGSLFIRPFREYIKTIHATAYICQAKNPVGKIYDAYEIEVKTPYGFEQSSVIISCEISPPLANSYVDIIGWLEKRNNEIIQLDLKPKTKYNLLSNKNLIIHNLSKSDDNRSYACIVRNQIDNNRKQSRFKLLRIRDRSPFGPELSIPNNTEYQGEINDLIELPCGISSISTTAQISWWKDGLEILHDEKNMYNNSRIFQLSSSTDSGNYACRVDDESIGRMTSTISLNVHVPTKCHINVPQIMNINAESIIELLCTINSIKNVSKQWQWYYNSVVLASNVNRYVIFNATREHMGMYQCCFISTSSDMNSCCTQTQIRIINSSPFIVDNHQNDIIISPQNHSHIPIDLNCTIYGDPTPEIHIFKDGQEISPHNQIEYLASGDVFLHYPISISTIIDTGLYQCIAINSFGSISLSKHINIEQQIPFIQPLTNFTVRNGEQFTIACYASGQPNLYLQWIDTIHNRIINTSTTSPILFTSIHTNSNTYTCQATNSYGQISSEVFLTVQIPAKILSITSNKTIRINENLNIYCSAEGDNQLELQLKSPLLKKLTIIETKHENFKNISITIHNMQMSDSGLYECEAKNNYSQDRSIIEIIVLNVPDKIENIFLEKSEKLSWIKPFDGNSKILQYILRIRYRQGLIWSNETIVNIDNQNITTYSFENVFSTCIISVVIQSINAIGMSLPSDPFRFQMDIKRLRIAPYNLIATNISSTSVTITWQYPSFHICNSSFTEFVVEVTNSYNQTHIYTHNYQSMEMTIHQLKSFTNYTVVIYAINELGSSPKSNSLKIQTLEYVPLLLIDDLTATLLNSSTAYITWTFEKKNLPLLNGKFRTFAITIYENFNMSTLTTIETIHTDYTLSNLHSSSQYYISVAICNSFDCGSSSLAIDVKTPSSIFDIATTLIHPINKPLRINCPSSPEKSLFIPHPSLSQTNTQYQCTSKLFNIQYYDKPSSIQTKVHYRLSNEIGLKIIYPSEIIESLTITYKIKDNVHINELNIFPPLSHIRLTNLSCGNFYEIMIYASNQAGFSSTEHLFTKTDGSVPSLIDSSDLVQSISSNYIILNMNNWIINECSILSYEIELISSKTNFSRYISHTNENSMIKIDQLQSNEYYELNIKVNSQAGENFQTISFQTTNEKLAGKTKLEQILMLSAFLLCLFILILIIMKIYRRRLRQTDSFINQNRKLKPVLCSANSDHFHRNWLRTDNEFTHQKDSQGNINPYAVTGYAMNYKDEANHGSFWRENQQKQCQNPHPSTTSSERYFRPIILKSSSTNEQDLSRRNPLIQISEKSILPNIHYTVSSSPTELFSAFTYVSTSKSTSRKCCPNDQSSSSADSGVHSSDTQSPRCLLHNFSFDQSSSLTNPRNVLYATYEETTTDSSPCQHYSLV